MPADPILRSHQEWLGYVQPVGVVVSTPALLEAGAAVNRNFVPLHREFVNLLPSDRDANPIPELRNFREFAISILGWRPTDLQTPPESFTISVQGYDDLLSPTYVVPDGDSTLLLIQEIDASDFDAELPGGQRHWNASPQMRFERLLRETGVPAGLLVSPRAIRLVYAPKGESSGHLTFQIADMVQVAGRPILAALHMLLSAEGLFSGLPDQRLAAILAASRRHQNQVSTKLSGQVMEALFDLLRGFQMAHDETNGALLAEVLRDDPNRIYAALLTVLLRLVFVLYAEDRGLLSSDPLYVNHYSVNGLFESLREDQGCYADTMDSRFGSWARLLTLFRLIYLGAQHGGMHIPGRKGYLFDPDRFPFLEGRPNKKSTEFRIPRVSDGVVYRVLSKLLLLDGERLSYRSLDVEQIGSVYEAMMGFELHVAQGPSIAIKAKKKHGAPVTIDLEDLLAIASGKRNEWLSKATDQKLSGTAERDLKQAGTIEDLIAALDRRIAKNVTSDKVPKGSLIFQPSPERRRSGSHYTPRSLTAPIVEATLEPVLNNLGPNPAPEQILALKVCDPAMGSGAFLVEACRQLGDALVEAWHKHNAMPVLPPDEDELLHARRLIAQRCLYGVDKNEMAVDLAKLSLWLATLARDHEFTFLNHALRHGDSLVGLTARQIAAFHWEPGPMQSFLEKDLRERIKRAADHRSKILSARDDVHYEYFSQELTKADEQLEMPRMSGDLVIAAFFEGNNRARRKAALQAAESEMKRYVERGEDEIGAELEGKRIAMRKAEKPLVPFHWEIEFPEVFQLDANLRTQSGFDAIIGNPPFAGKNTLFEAHADGYLDWLKTLHEHSHGNSDLVAHFYRRAFNLLRRQCCFGLIATKTIRQGDTRSTGLRWIRTHDGTIYRARRRIVWPGEAAVTVSVVHVCKGPWDGPVYLDERPVTLITAYLFHGGNDSNPEALTENRHKAFKGAEPGSLGYLLEPEDINYAEFSQLCHPLDRSKPLLKSYIGGDELNDDKRPRCVLDVDGLSEEQISSLPGVLTYLEERVRPDFLERGEIRPDTREWWHFRRPTAGLREAIRGLNNCFACSRHSAHLAFALRSADEILAESMVVIASQSLSCFAVLQSRSHEVWARFFGSSLEDRLRYTPSDCFETFPFPAGDETNSTLEQAGHTYYNFRADLMVRNNEGLTKTYNRFHNPNERSPDINKLRELHDAMDRAVLDAYGWSDIRPVCEFFPEFEEDDDTEEQESGRTRAKRYRYRWPDDIHDEVLARLLALNQQRAAVPNVETQPPPNNGKRSRKPKKPKVSTPSLFEPQLT